MNTKKLPLIAAGAENGITNSAGSNLPDLVWLSPPKKIALNDGEVHIWRFSLSAPASKVRWFRRMLASEELDRAERFYFEKDYIHYIVGRGMLRTILSHYLNIEPDKLIFRYGKYGKPELDGFPKETMLRFNLAHSHGLGLLAIVQQLEVGVDIERIRPNFADHQISEHFFSPGELKTLTALPSHLKETAFFTCWTRKEAFLKAKGDGLNYDLRRFEVSLAPNEAPALLHIDGREEEVIQWSIIDLNPGQGYVGALAVKGKDLRLKSWSLL